METELSTGNSYISLRARKSQHRKYKNKLREMNFVLDCKTAIYQEYEPFNDLSLKNFFQSGGRVRHMKKIGLINKKGNFT